MELKTYRAKSLQAALQLVRRELGPDASVLHTREVRSGMLRWLRGRQIEVTASASVNVPSRFGRREPAAAGARLPGPPSPAGAAERTAAPAAAAPAAAAPATVTRESRDELKEQLSELQSMVEALCRRDRPGRAAEVPESMFHLYTDLIEAELSEEMARELIERVGDVEPDHKDPVLLKARLARLVESEIRTSGPIAVTPGQRRLVALVGPTGVGKTTTIAKLAADFHLREQHRVGLITVDTYRIAAVDQLRTYADIIDLPMEVVATPREMRAAVERLSDLDLILMDTAGRSPRDEVKIRELKSMLSEAEADEVHLVLSSVSGAASMTKSARRFAEVGATSLILTKLDEATGLGNLLPVLRTCQLPLSYTTNGQNVPDDIAPADAPQLARLVLGVEDER